MHVRSALPKTLPLVSQASTPWRSVRFFFYGAFAFSAGVGLLTALAQLAGSLARQPNALPLSQSAQNVAVDLGVVGLCVLGYVVDSRAAVDVVTEPSKALSDDEAAERSFKLASLRVEIGTEERRRVATLETLRTKAGQSVVVLGGPAKAVNEALTDALIQQKLLARAECVIVPVRTDIVEPQKIDRTGFIASIPPDERDDWLEYVADEIKTARDQGADDADSAGVVIAVRNDGTVARRGVGKPPWREVIAQLADDAPATDKVAK